MQVVQQTGRGMDGKNFPLATIETSFGVEHCRDAGHGASLVQTHGGCAHGWFKKLLGVWYPDEPIIKNLSKENPNHEYARMVSLGQPFSPLMLEILKKQQKIAATENTPPKICFNETAPHRALTRFNTDDGQGGVSFHPKILQTQAVQHFRAIFDPEASDLTGLTEDYSYWMLSSFFKLFEDSLQDYAEEIKNLDTRVAEIFIKSDDTDNETGIKTLLESLTYDEGNFCGTFQVMEQRRNEIIKLAEQAYDEKKQNTDWQQVAAGINQRSDLAISQKAQELLEKLLTKMQHVVTFDPNNPEDYATLVLNEEEFLGFYRVHS